MSKIFVDFKPAKLSKGETWYIYYYVKNPFIDNKLERKRIKLNHIKSKKERLKYAELMITEINQKLFNGYNPFLDDADIKPIYIQEAIDNFIKNHKHLRKDSIRSYKSICKIFSEHLKNRRLLRLKCYEFTESDAKRFILSLEVSNTTQNNYLRFMRTLFNWFIEQKYTDSNPFSKIKTKKQDPKYRTTIPNEIKEKIKDYLSKNDFSFYIFCQFTYKLLLRPSESFKLKISDIDFEEKMIMLPAASAKDHDNRIIYVPKDIWEYLETLKKMPKNLYIFSNNYIPGDKQKNTRDSGRSWANLRKKLKLSDTYTFYSLKDTGITELLESGVPATIVQQMAGHSSLEMTEKYAHRLNAKKMLKYNNLEF